MSDFRYRKSYSVKRGRVFRIKLDAPSDPDELITASVAVRAVAKPIPDRNAAIPDDTVVGLELTEIFHAGGGGTDYAGWFLELSETQTEAMDSDFYVLDCWIGLPAGAPIESAVTLEVTGRASKAPA
jgi:hypothetical protein